MRKAAAIFGFMLAGIYGAQLMWVICTPKTEAVPVQMPDETLAILRQNAIGLWLLGALFCVIAINAYRWLT